MDARRRWATAAALGGVLLLASGCAGQPGVACPELALLEGFPVVVEAGVAPAVALEYVELKACQDGTCHRQDIVVVPGSTSVDAGCSPAASANGDTPCSALAVPDGTLVGYWATGDFGPGPIDVEASAPGFGPVRGTVEGRLESSGSGACLQRVFQTPLRIGAGGIESPAG
ncbi:hypothetical protein [Paeniglutamicibacter sp. NPDC091659]|uniref:hypothetical protein n=1 Tax=Paeniglutamicibacter sp. NPDC091659 TaxID=3364389 RepID=UPI003828318B